MRSPIEAEGSWIVGVERNQLGAKSLPSACPFVGCASVPRLSPRTASLAAGYGSEGDRERRFVLYRSADKSKTVDLIKDVTRDGWDISPKGELLAVGLSLGDIRTYSLPDGQPLSEPGREKEAQWEARRISCVRFDPSGKLWRNAANPAASTLMFGILPTAKRLPTRIPPEWWEWIGTRTVICWPRRAKMARSTFSTLKPERTSAPTAPQQSYTACRLL
jgi:hypothetical protein